MRRATTRHNPQSFVGFVCAALILSGLAVVIPDYRADAQQVGSRTTSNATGIQVNGQPFFPVGFYGLTWSLPFSERMAALDAIAGGGFNTIAAEDISTPTFGQFLDRAQQQNVKVMVGGSSLLDNQFIVATVTTYREHPAVLGWSLFDDADDGKVSEAGLLQRSNLVKSLDSQHFTYAPLTGYTPARRQAKAGFIAGSDVSSLQMYPITPLPDYYFQYGGNPLAESFRATEQYVQAAAQQGKPFVSNAQTFRWGTPTGRYPTVLELRNMFYGQLMAGTKGIISYDFSFDLLNNQPALWNEYRALAADVLGPMNEPILKGEMVRVPTGVADIEITTWRLNGDLYVGILNTSLTVSHAVDLPLQSQYLGQGTPISPRLAGLAVSGGRVSGTLGATEVAVYKVSGNAEPTLPPPPTLVGDTLPPITPSLTTPPSTTSPSTTSLSTTASTTRVRATVRSRRPRRIATTVGLPPAAATNQTPKK